MRQGDRFREETRVGHMLGLSSSLHWVRVIGMSLRSPGNLDERNRVDPTAREREPTAERWRHVVDHAAARGYRPPLECLAFGIEARQHVRRGGQLDVPNDVFDDGDGVGPSLARLATATPRPRRSSDPNWPRYPLA